ncbi:quinolinate synthase NadA [Candidatus Bathyarchaeota archaeon]|nr:MAG: quinolinate synthase NadA [Candidatus Bathyarchaeota archaeon]
MAHDGYVEKLKREIRDLCEKRKAVILAHNYQSPEVQDVADYIGDSLELARKAVDVNADIIVFAGVSFMAEMVAVLNEDKTVLHPVREAGCPLADFLDVETAKKFREKYPDAPFVIYVNSYAKTKIHADYIVTSASALNLISKLDADTILFGPDKNLASYVAKRTDKEIIAVPPHGYCYVHEYLISRYDIEKAKDEWADAKILVHPEVLPENQKLADYVGSTSQMLRAIGELGGNSFLLGTEEGLSYRAKNLYPDKEIYPINPRAVCIDMKKINLLSIKKSLETNRPKISLEKNTRDKVRSILESSLEMIK